MGAQLTAGGEWKRAAEVIRSYGGLFISDEVQTGFGRTGGAWFGIEHSDVVPDIMVMAKGIANGFPVAATIATLALAQCAGASLIEASVIANAAAGAVVQKIGTATPSPDEVRELLPAAIAAASAEESK